MSSTLKVACVQNCATDIERDNLDETERLSRQAHAAGAELICLPEFFACIQPSDDLYVGYARDESSHTALVHYQALARELNAWFLLGSIAVPFGPDRVANRSILLDPKGEIVARYDKAHLFDISLKDGESYEESRVVAPGTQAVVASTPWGRLGLSVCYDVRFAYLYRALAQAGAEFITIPAAFTRTTGRAHWHVLVRARAIETGSFVFAPDQCGVRPWGRATYGHSLIVSPWGEVLAEGGDEAGYILAEIDPVQVAEARRMIPSLQHDRGVSPPT